MSKVRTSKWWRYFESNVDELPKCLLCKNDKGILKSWNSANARSHMENHHLDEFNKINAEVNADKPETSTPKKRRLDVLQPTIKQAFAPISDEM